MNKDVKSNPAVLDASEQVATGDIISALGFQAEMDTLRGAIGQWVENADVEMREMLTHQFQARSKYFRPLTIFSCYRATSAQTIPGALITAAQVIEMFHNVSLIVDDIVDESHERRGVPTLYREFQLLPALMASGYIVAEGYEILSRQLQENSCTVQYQIGLFSELMKRLGVAECKQWRLRRQPLGVADWEDIAQEDTGSMFEVCACLGGQSEHLRMFGRYLGMLYHGCDDVGDVKGLTALGGGGEEDLRDGILTLPAALAIRDDSIRELFCNPGPSREVLQRLALAYRAQIPDAELHLDEIADRARRQARDYSVFPEPLIALVDHTRHLSRR